MGWLKDAGTSPVAKWGTDGYPYDEHGHRLYLEKGPIGRDVDMWGNPEYAHATSPYGHLTFAIGSAVDFHCFDFHCFSDGIVALHAVVNSETGSFIQDAYYTLVPKGQAGQAAQAMVDDAISWCCDNDVFHDKDGWNQDPQYFVEEVKRCTV